ncbi:glycoside hydrolase family 19 protein [Pseudomonas tohonis]|uniref:glycoside hydrolase family 19 protein n=1 Tax=Pseudomonas tohonis TaxID=2725477 RepID=UPI001F47F34E|nr:glycoside hydrolase family 19 protein [Pseudomonas tohonis]GJN49429.1 lysozyme [Pseudomonas tohonis]
MQLTEQQLLQILPNAGRQAGVFVSPINAAAKRWQINTPKRLAAFLAQIGHESGQLRYVKEIWGPTPAQDGYDVRADLGNTPERDGDGRLYMGRGLLQITGRTNYIKCSVALFGDQRLVTEPQLLELPEHAAQSAAWFWWVRELNSLADRGQFTQITKRINGGQNGAQDRLQIWQRARAVLGT